MEPVFLACVGIGVVGLVATLRVRRSSALLESWVRSNGYRLVTSRFCWFWRGPFWFRSSKGQTVYEVTIQEPSGRKRHGWVLCGNYFLGLIGDKVDVQWDD